MQSIEIIVWTFTAIVVYTYAGYPAFLFLLVKLLRPAQETPRLGENLPTVTLLVPSYNELRFLPEKIKNARALEYPPEKFRIVVITDGSSDGSEKLADQFPDVQWYHQPERQGKTAAINRVMPEITSDITVFSDANTRLNPGAIKAMVTWFTDRTVGVVAGEKRVASASSDKAAASGEGFYWKYESTLKKLDSRLYSVIGAAGELLAVRTDLYFPIESSVIIEDFYLSLKLAMGGRVTRYAPEAIAVEKGSASIREEFKRKIRIAAGGLQAIGLLLPLLNVFKFGWLSFQYISHRVLRWTLAPIGLIVIFFGSLAAGLNGNTLLANLFLVQGVFYLFAVLGAIFMERNIRIKLLFIPFYFSMMNYAVFAGFIKLISGKDFSIWEKSKRAT